MENMIKRIVEVDEKARRMTEEAQHAKVHSSADIEKQRETMREEYLSRARARIKVNEQTEQAAADKEWEEIHQKYLQLSKKLDQKYAENCDAWVDEIFQRVIGG